VKKYYIEVKKATLKDQKSDLSRIFKKLEEFDLKNLKIDHLVLRELPVKIREGGWKITVALNENEIIGIEPGCSEKLYGIAFDVGTTTVVGYLVNLRTGKFFVESITNPQVTYGEDVMSRISCSMKGKLREMNEKIVEGLNRIVEKTALMAGISPGEILDATVVGNTVMHHILLNLNPTYLGASPFPPVLQEGYKVKARDLGLKIGKGAYVYFLPNIGGFVGSDAVGVLISTEPYKSEEPCLVIDIGTNGEIALGNREKISIASCATGPALEGAHIKFGMRACEGAIEDLRIEGQDVFFKVIGEAKPKGICGSGVVKAVAELYRTGILSKDGKFKDMNISRLRKGEDGLEFVIARKEETSIGKDIVITQKDIRNVQLAKAALYAGARVLMKKMKTNVEKIILAGAFGNKIDKEAAIGIGMLPECDRRKIVDAGNAAGSGAMLALIGLDKRKEAEEIAQKVEYVELTVEPDFEKEFIRGMHFP
jgi:uncharacterized 2Fe-2S/4Fe-4S cluster protein (DUF4445 family)